MNEGVVSTELGIGGAPAAAEDVMVARDVLLAELTGAHVHIAHLSTAGAVRLVREAKARGRPRDGRGDAAPPRPHRRGRARVRPQHQDESAAPDQARHRGRSGGADRRDHRLHRHRPRAPRRVREGGRVRPGAVRDRRAGDRGRPSCSTGWSGRACCPSATLVSRLSADPARLLGLPGGSLRPGAPGDRDDSRSRAGTDRRPRAVSIARAATRPSRAGRSAEVPP